MSNEPLFAIGDGIALGGGDPSSLLALNSEILFFGRDGSEAAATAVLESPITAPVEGEGGTGVAPPPPPEPVEADIPPAPPDDDSV